MATFMGIFTVITILLLPVNRCLKLLYCVIYGHYDQVSKFT